MVSLPIEGALFWIKHVWNKTASIFLFSDDFILPDFSAHWSNVLFEKSGNNFSIIDVLAHINIHLPVLKSVPSDYVGIISECSINLAKSMGQPQNAHHKALSAAIPGIINWIQETN